MNDVASRSSTTPAGLPEALVAEASNDAYCAPSRSPAGRPTEVGVRSNVPLTNMRVAPVDRPEPPSTHPLTVPSAETTRPDVPATRSTMTLPVRAALAGSVAAVSGNAKRITAP